LLGGACPLLGGDAAAELHDGSRELAGRREELVVAAVLTAGEGERAVDLVLVGLDVLATAVGQGVGAARAVGLREEPLVDELGEGRIDRAGARRPGALGALGDRLDEAVAVRRA